MALIRAFETQVADLYRDGEIPGFVHTSLGQEAVAAGVCAVLGREDYVTTTHRGHGHVLAKGADVERDDGRSCSPARQACARAREGRCTLRIPRSGSSARTRSWAPACRWPPGGPFEQAPAPGRVAVAFFGEGAVEPGLLPRGRQLAAIWDLPAIFVCENNRYAEFTDSPRCRASRRSLERRGRLRRLGDRGRRQRRAGRPHGACDAAARSAPARGPVLIEASTYRWHGHYEGTASRTSRATKPTLASAR